MESSLTARLSAGGLQPVGDIFDELGLGRPPSPQISRWIHRGNGGVKLVAVKAQGRWYSSRHEVCRWIDDQQPDFGDDGIDHDEVDAELAERGYL